MTKTQVPYLFYYVSDLFMNGSEFQAGLDQQGTKTKLSGLLHKGFSFIGYFPVCLFCLLEALIAFNSKRILVS